MNIYNENIEEPIILNKHNYKVIKKIQKLVRREYLRGFIDGGHLGKKYDFSVLKSKYRQYIKCNPNVRKIIVISNNL